MKILTHSNLRTWGMRALLLPALTLGISLAAVAKPAKTGILNATQPDGTTLQIMMHGDERGHIATTTDGYPLVWDNNNGYVYASVSTDGLLIPSGIKATNVNARSTQANSFLSAISKDDAEKAYNKNREKARITPLPSRFDKFANNNADGPQRGPGLFPGTHFPANGQQKGLVILVEYTDVKFDSQNSANYKYSKYVNANGTASTANDYWSEMLNREGFTAYGRGTGSCRDFFMQNSMNDGQSQFIPNFDLYGPVTLSNAMSYYGGNDSYGNDQNPEMMVYEACKLLDSQINFKDYDRDNDGYVDNVYVFYAGKGEADGGGSNTVWPHSWNLSSAGRSLTLDGVKIDRYGCSNETDNQSKMPDGIGTFVHEFSHVMGLPDLYATSYTSSYTPGEYSCMDYGPYNNGGNTPPCYSAFERYALSWTEPKTFGKEKDYTLEPIFDTNECYLVPTEKTNEFFLCESRPKRGWDAYIPGHGMLIWHIDYNSTVWNSNKVNNTPSHQYVDLIEANNTQSSSAAAGHPFPGTSNVRTYDFKSWASKSCGVHFTNITENTNTGTITLHSKNDNYVPNPNEIFMHDHIYYFIKDGNIQKTTVETWVDYSDGKTVTIGALKPNFGVDINNITVKVNAESKPATTVNSDNYYVATFTGPYTNGQKLNCEVTFNYAGGAATVPFTINYGSDVVYTPNAPVTFKKDINKIATGTSQTPEIVNTQNLPLTFNIADTSVATVDANGKVSGIKAGSTTLTATFAGNTSFLPATFTTTISVGKIDPPITMSETDITIGCGEEKYLAITNTENLPLTYTLSNPSVATINADGLVTGQIVGETDLAISFAGSEGYDPITFNAHITVNKGDAPIFLNTIFYQIEEGETVPLDLGNPFNLTLKFISSDKNIATINDNGEITGVAVGKTKVAAAFAGDDNFYGGSVYANVTVTQFTGIDNIEATDETPVYYDLTGNRISTPRKGEIVIKVQGSKHSKIKF